MEPKRPELDSIYSNQKSVTFLHNCNAQLEIGARGVGGTIIYYIIEQHKKVRKKGNSLGIEF